MNITLLSTGGTIASTETDTGAKPTHTGPELLEAVPELETYATLSVESVAQIPSFEMDAETLKGIADRVDELDADPTVDAVVITHGRTRWKETAYYLDVTIRPESPEF